MNSMTEMLQQGSTNLWLFIPSAILLGALHGLEPGHSKTMMAAFIIAVRGTVSQAVLLGLSATISHTAVVWVIALGGQYFGRNWSSEATEPYLQMASAVLIVGIALWMIWRTWREQNAESEHEHHHHGEEMGRIETAHGTVALEVFEDSVPPRWRIRFEHGEHFAAGNVTVETIRPDLTRQVFQFLDRNGFLESVDEIPEPHAFTARIHLAQDGYTHSYGVEYTEHDHGHMNLGAEDDAHARAHADDIRRRFAGRTVTTGQIVIFGLTGGLIPCPAAITVLLLCIQLKQLSLGFLLVLCFSIGLAVTMVSAGVLAALSMRHVEKRWSGFSSFARKAPYASAVLIIGVGLYMGVEGWLALPAGAL
ncbi:nickel/cobalt efflux transporter [Roseiarcaceae bacterium H3SJ34-1]|uniref:nickel/cobalt efflux transporter n=1 Tax=Terripilifer ovatus TaxID=3032367 RepID=UPI003AB9B779|nr:nickel/cobalt efflux transporter [Roseiarcaceae bacterium H3SJ34-1]